MSALRSLATVLGGLSLVAGGTAQVDWRLAQSPVKSQGQRGTCAAFAICGALETFPGIPGDLSEQLLYATLKLHQNEVVGWLRKFGKDAKLGEGDLLDAYLPLFTFLGTCPESLLPYDPDPKRAGPDVPAEIKRYLELAQLTPTDLERIRDGFGKYGISEDAFTVFDREAARDPAIFKRLLAGGALAIPIGYALHGPSWSKLAELGMSGDDRRRLYVHPGMMYRFAGADGEWKPYNQTLLDCMKAGEDFVTQVQSGNLRTQRLGPQHEYGGHAVLLVGYDERGFLAKNSWGTGWGDGGYFRITWDYHRLYAIQALELRRARIRMPSLNPFETTNRIKQGRFRLKLQRLAGGRTPRLVLSTWMEEPRDAGYRVVEYTVETIDEAGEWHELTRRLIDAGSDQARTGAPFHVGGPLGARLYGSASVRIRLRVGTDMLTASDGTQTTLWQRTLQFPAFDPKMLTATMDLVPARQ